MNQPWVYMCSPSQSLLFNMLSRLVITFLPRSKRLLISWLQSPSAVIGWKWKWSCSFMFDSLWPHGLPIAYQASLSVGFSRQEYWSGLPFPSPQWYGIPPQMAQSSERNHKGIQLTLEDYWPLQAKHSQPERLSSHQISSNLHWVVLKLWDSNFLISYKCCLTSK